MRKIYIITRHAISNYGSILQAYATCEFLKSIGFEPLIIDYISKSESVFNNVKNYANSKKLSFFKKIIYFILKIPTEWLKERRFLKMRNRILPLTKRFRSCKDLKDLCTDGILVSGGDQLWGYMPSNLLDTNYYLSFSDDSNKLFSISSSFGRYDFKKNELETIYKLLSRYKKITVREESAVLFLDKIGIQSELVLDPTLLVDEKIWNSLCSYKIMAGDYIVVYKLREDKELDSLAIRLACDLKCKILYVTNSIFLKHLNGKNIANKDVEYVLSLIKNSKLVITDSFHATVFSVVFNKNFYTHIPPLTGSRLLDFLNMMNLSDRMYSFADEVKNVCNIDYNKVNSLLLSRRIHSTKIIKDMLCNQ